MLFKLFLTHHAHLTHLKRHLLALLKQLLLLHVILSEQHITLVLRMLIWAVFIQACGIFQEELAILGPPERCPYQPALIHKLINSQYGYRRFLGRRVGNVD